VTFIARVLILSISAQRFRAAAAKAFHTWTREFAMCTGAERLMQRRVHGGSETDAKKLANVGQWSEMRQIFHKVV